MKKYAQVQDIVGRLTDNKTFCTFFNLYLMAENAEERDAHNEQFWRDAKTLSSAGLLLLKAEFIRCFLRFSEMATDLLGHVSAKTA